MDSGLIGKYRILRRIAAGGMGELFLARQEGPAGFSKTVAVKRILEHLSNNNDFVEMFLNEARVAALLSHPNVVQIFELGQDGSSYFIAMEYVHGASLKDIKKKCAETGTPAPFGLVAKICADALRGLDYAHSLKDSNGAPLRIIHRDVTPENILVGFNGAVKVVDFGIAKVSGNRLDETQQGTLKGKLSYMCPEYILGQPLDGRVDVYAMGAVLYEIFSNVRPFTAINEAALLHTILHKTPKPLSDLVPNLPPVIEEIVTKALSKKPEYRFASAEEMARALDQFSLSTGVPVAPSNVGDFLRQLFPTDAATSLSEMPTPIRTSSKETVVKAPEVPPPLPPLPAEDSPPTVSSHRKREKLSVRNKRLAVGGAGLAVLFLAWLLWPAPDVPPVTPQPVAVAEPPPAAVESPKAPAPPEETSAPPIAENPPPPHEEVPTTVTVENTTPTRRKRQSKVATAPAKPKLGTIVVRVHPWAEVVIGEKNYGVTPIAPIQVPAGRHTVRLRNSSMGVEKSVVVNVSGGKSSLLKVDMIE